MKQWRITVLGLFLLFPIIFAQVPFGNALIVGNTREYISIPIDTTLQVRGDVTVEAWVNIASVPKAPFAQIVQQTGVGLSDLERDNALYTLGLTNEGLVGYWRFDKLENLGVNTNSADDFRDFSVNENHGELIRPEERISWLGDLDEAKVQALRENKLILAEFWASWCGPCLAMDRDVWSRKDIANLSDKFVCLKLDFDKEKKASWHYQVQAIPAILFLDAFGNKIAHIIGYRSAQQMEEIMIALPKDLSDVYILLQRIEKEKGNADLIIDLADRYRLWGLKRMSNTYYKKASKLKKVKKDPKKLDHVQTFTAVNYLFLDEPKRARKVFEKCLKKFPKSENRPLHLYCLVRAHMTLGKEKKAREYYTTLLKEFPDNKHTKWADELMNGSN